MARTSSLVTFWVPAAFLVAICAAEPTRATTLTVPTDVPTIQMAIDTGVDTVLVLPGAYAETPTLYQPIALLAFSTDPLNLVVLAGLRLHLQQTASVAPYSLYRLDVATPVVIRNDRDACTISLVECVFRDGVEDTSPGVETDEISLLRCQLTGFSEFVARSWIRVDSCVINGRVYACGGQPGLVVRGSAFQGNGVGTAISGCLLGGANIQGNTIRGYRLGVGVAGESTIIANNLVEDCSATGIGAEGTDVIVRNNVVRRFGDQRGIGVSSRRQIRVLDNSVTGGAGAGIEVLEGEEVDIASNVVWDCGGTGVWIADQWPRLRVKVSSNTSCRNVGSGFLWENTYPNIKENEWTQNIGWSNGGHGLKWVSTDNGGTVGCNNWAANAAGNVEGVPPSSTDLSVDPEFCDPDEGDFQLNSASPLVELPGCGQIGALGVGCGKTPTLVQRFTADRVGNGVRIVWQVAEGASAADVWLERSESSQGKAWIRPITERSMEAGATIELDRSAGVGRAYWYRLVAFESHGTIVIGHPVEVALEAPLQFRLAEVGPNPGVGPVRFGFRLQHTAAIEIGVFDVQGREIASIGRGLWPAGAHESAWDGRTDGGQLAPAGLYVLRYAYPGGEDRRHLVRLP